jgi:6,7-dimethyl-8-ribityllumazine synthase
MRIIEGQFKATSGKIAIIASRFNDLVVHPLVRGAIDTLKRHGVSEKQIELVWVPGAYELAFIAQRLAKTGNYQGIIALGAVIRGATTHYDYVAGEAASGLARAACDTGIPMTFGVLTTENLEQALERAGSKVGNKGSDAAMGLLELLDLLEQIDG